METQTRSPSTSRLLADQSVAFAARTLRTLRRNGAVVFWAVGFPSMFYLLSVYLFIDASTIPADYLPTVKATTAVSYGTFGALVVFLNTFAQSLVADVESGRYAQYRALPVRPAADFLGRFAAAFLFALAAVGCVLAVGAATGAEYQLRAVASLPVAVVGLFALGLFTASLAVVLVAVVPDAKFVSIVAISGVTLSYFLTGYNGTQPEMVATGADALNYLPNSLATRLAVYHLVPVGDWAQSSLGPPAAPAGIGFLALLAGYALLGLGIAVLATRYALYRGEAR